MYGIQQHYNNVRNSTKLQYCTEFNKITICTEFNKITIMYGIQQNYNNVRNSTKLRYCTEFNKITIKYEIQQNNKNLRNSTKFSHIEPQIFRHNIKQKLKYNSNNFVKFLFKKVENFKFILDVNFESFKHFD